MLKLVAIGNLGADPEMDYTRDGMARSRFRVGCTTGRKDPETGERETAWLACTAFGKTAENVAEFCHKGSRVYVEGRAEARPWTTRDGEARASLDVTIAYVEFLTPREQAGRRPEPTLQEPARQAPGAYGDDVDDLPF